MEVSIQRWRQAQQGEREFWDGCAEFIRCAGYRRRIEARARRLGEWLGPRLGPVNCRALEIGGGGTQLLDFLPAALRVSVDPLAEFYQRRFGDVLSGAVLPLASRGEELPFERAVFDLVLCRNVLDHVQRPAAVLGELVRVLKPGGLLYLALNTFAGPLLWYKSIHPPIEEPHLFSSASLDRLLAGRQLVKLDRKVDQPEEMEHFNGPGIPPRLRDYLRRGLVAFSCLRFEELLLQKQPV